MGVNIHRHRHQQPRTTTFLQHHNYLLSEPQQSRPVTQPANSLKACDDKVEIYLSVKLRLHQNDNDYEVKGTIP